MSRFMFGGYMDSVGNFNLSSNRHWWFINESDEVSSDGSHYDEGKMGFINGRIEDVTYYALFYDMELTKEIHPWARVNSIDLTNLSDQDIELLKIKFDRVYETTNQGPPGIQGKK